MDKLHADFLQIIKSALEASHAPLAETWNLDELYKIAQRHRITTMFYYGLIHSGLSSQDSFMQSLFGSVCYDVITSETQKHELRRIVAAFDEHQIDYMLLKGAELKEIYPKPEMRPMGDIDILIRITQYQQIKPIMEALGFTEYDESNHEYIWSKDGCLIELHKFLIPSYNTDFFSYYGDGWRLAKNVAGTHYTLSDEDCFIYLFTHFAKHYRDSGIGLRHIVDIWVYVSTHPNLNHTYILSELEKLQLDEFYLNILATLKNWFCDAPSNHITEFITEFIFSNGVYGTKHTHILAMALRDKKAKKSLWHIRFQKMYHSIFVSYNGMCKLYPILSKWPVLLPLYWGVHLFRRIFVKKQLKSYSNDMTLLNHEDISEYEKALNFVGLAFRFEE